MIDLRKMEWYLIKCAAVCLAGSFLTAVNPAFYSAYEAAKYAEKLSAAKEDVQMPQNTVESALTESLNLKSQTEEQYEHFAVAKVSGYVNVRKNAGTSSEIVGHIYNDSVCEITEQVEAEDGLWFGIVSGNVEGYVKAEFFVYGADAQEILKEHVTKVAQVLCDRLNIRAEADTGSSKIGSAKNGDCLKVADDEEIGFTENWREILGGNSENGSEGSQETLALKWVKIEYKNGQTGYVCLDYVVIRPEYTTAKTIAEEKAEARRKVEAASQAAEAKQTKAERTAVEAEASFAAANINYSDNSELRSNIIEYAKQFVGMKYVSGGKSLESGTDCSGFTCFVLNEFGYSIGRTPAGQYSYAGRSISLSEAQPGDIICYGSGSCTHVAFYMGDNKIIHEANSRDGCIISDVTFMNILGVRNVID